MKQSQSHNTAVAKSVRNILAPSWLQVTAYLISGLLMLILLNLNTLWDYFNKNISGAAESADQLISAQLNNFSQVISEPWEGRLVPMALWAVIGCFAYMSVWIIQNAYISLRNDLAAEKFKHPDTFNRRHYWRSVLANKIFLVCSLFMLAFFVYLASALVVPVLTKLFFSAISNWQLLPSVTKIAVSVIASGFLVFLGLIISRLVVSSWRWMTSNL